MLIASMSLMSTSLQPQMTTNPDTSRAASTPLRHLTATQNPARSQMAEQWLSMGLTMILITLFGTTWTRMERVAVSTRRAETTGRRIKGVETKRVSTLTRMIRKTGRATTTRRPPSMSLRGVCRALTAKTQLNIVTTTRHLTVATSLLLLKWKPNELYTAHKQPQLRTLDGKRSPVGNEKSIYTLLDTCAIYLVN
jgi:hypothetical protein